MSLHAPGPADARSPERPLITLSCPTEVPDAEALCQAVIQALAETGPSHLVHRVARGQERASRPGDLGVALHMDGRDSHGMAGRLDWQAPGAAGSRGPEIRFDVVDAEVSPQMYASFARGLVRGTPGLAAALRAAP